MKIEGEYVFDAPREEVWKVVRDPEVLTTCVPSVQSVSKVNENEFTGEIVLRIGPLSGAFGGRVTVGNEVPPESCTLTVEGTGKIGFLKGVGNVVLVEQDGGKTLMKYSGEAQIGGKVASVGQRLFDSVSKGMIKQGLDKLNDILVKRMAA
ncbi:MAG: carbon monoxide dehydrogenase subunit G [Chloroflexi bacterium]|nr:carbon monoxide dehydrogenase subunit G [Chloroflexota bacterium]